MRLAAALTVGLVLSASLASGDEKEDEAVKLIEKKGGTVTWDENASGRPVIAVKLKQAEITDADMRLIGGLKHLRELNLNLSLTPVTATGLRELKGLKDLRVLELAVAGVADNDYKALGELTQLEVLNLWGTTITDDGL